MVADPAPRCSTFVTETSAFGDFCWLLGDEHGDSDDEMHRSGMGFGSISEMDV